MAMKRASVLDQLPDNPSVESGPTTAVADRNAKSVHRPGDPCETVNAKGNQCNGVLSTTSTFLHEDGRRTRYLQCRVCRKPDPQYKQSVPSPNFGSGKRNTR